MSQPVRFAGRRILIAEDSPTQAEFLRHILASGGCEVVVTASGSEALAAIRQNPPELVLTDILMPGMDGYELCRAIKGDTKTGGIPVILVTQLSDPSDILKGLESGADNYIVKPFDAAQVFSRISTVLGDAEMQGTARQVTPASGKDRERHRMLTILFSTYEDAVKKNAELQEAHEEAAALNQELMATVDELQQANRNLSRENAERSRVEKALADANRKLNLMTSITRHDINNQLLGLMAYIDLAEMEIGDPLILQYIRKARNATQTIQKQIAFTKEYEDIGVQAPQWHDIRTMIEPLRSYLKGAGITLQLRDPHLEIYADPLLPKVFENLVDNSIRHGKNVQHITVSSSRATSGALVIAFCDDGEGVAEEDKEKIFGKGFGKNTGLGLFLTREILGITGITIHETGIPGKGACFEIAVPPEGVRKTLSP